MIQCLLLHFYTSFVAAVVFVLLRVLCVFGVAVFVSRPIINFHHNIYQYILLYYLITWSSLLSESQRWVNFPMNPPMPRRKCWNLLTLWVTASAQVLLRILTRSYITCAWANVQLNSSIVHTIHSFNHFFSDNCVYFMNELLQKQLHH